METLCPYTTLFRAIVDDVDVVALDLARTYLRRLGDDRSRVADSSPADLCRALGVADAKGKLNRAGELIFCAASFDVIVYQYRHTMGGPTVSVERLRPPLKIGRAHVCTPVTNAHLVCRL